MTEPPVIQLPRPDSWVSAEFGVSLRTVSSTVGLEITDLVGLALRRNPRRAHLLVSSVLGKHVVVDPDLVAAAARLLGEVVAQRLDFGDTEVDWSALVRSALCDGATGPLLAALDQVSTTRPVSSIVVLGFAETATALGHLVADQLGADCYLHSTRRHVAGVEVAGTFEEGHSHATSHRLLPVPADLLDTDGPLVLVDDELSTGTTALATIVEAHRRRPRARYLVASLIDLRSTDDEARTQATADRLQCRIDVVSLARGAVDLPDDLLASVARRLADLDAGSHTNTDLARRPVTVAGPAQRVQIPWPADVPDGGRHGFRTADRPAFGEALTVASAVLSAVVRARITELGGDRVLVVGTEELMYLPLRLAQHLAGDTGLTVGFQSTTRSPVLAVDDPGYPIRRAISFADPEGDQEVPRFLYNAQWTARGGGRPAGGGGRPAGGDGRTMEPDLVVLVADAAADTPTLASPTGPVAALQDLGIPVTVAVLGAVDPARLGSARSARTLPSPLTGPSFGSYRSEEVQWLLTDLSNIDLEGDIADREAAIQAGTAHYAESLPVEFQPDAQYRELFEKVLSQSARRLALAVGRVTELVIRERGKDIVLASLARAGTPIGILMRRWAQYCHGLDLPHYALSIVRGRGIDAVALRYLAAHHQPSQVVFVDGWTGKGAIAKELSAALQEIRAQDATLDFNDDLAVLADPGYCVRTFGTRDDFLIASACLNSTVSGLISRTVLNEAYLAPGQFHGAKFYRELAVEDVSAVLLDAISAAFPSVETEVVAGVPALADSDREPTFAGWSAIESIRAEFGIESVNFVKPGVGETTRVLLRRVPWRILVREADNPDHAHLRLLALQRHVPVEVRPDLPYSCVGLIRRLSGSEPGEG